jgi:hypothetical protein
MEKILAIVLVILFAVAIVAIIYFTATPAGVAAWNTWWHGVQKADDVTDYETIKKVEDTCRAMIASYESDKLTYEQYKDSDNEEKQSWAEQAKMRANKTAVEYNNYILKNTYIWKGNVPADIYMKLEIIE